MTCSLSFSISSCAQSPLTCIIVIVHFVLQCNCAAVLSLNRQGRIAQECTPHSRVNRMEATYCLCVVQLLGCWVCLVLFGPSVISGAVDCFGLFFVSQVAGLIASLCILEDSRIIGGRKVK